MKKLAIVILLFSGSYLQAQDPFLNLMTAMSESQENGTRDINTILNGYMNPLMKGIGYGFSNGWYNTAKAHESLGFDLTFTTTFVTVPDDDLFYQIGTLEELSITRPVQPAEVPTVFGPNTAPEFMHNTTGQTFDGLPGVDMQGLVGFSAVPIPMPQIGIGIIKGTELRFRYLPTINVEQVSASLWGVGVLHDFKQHIPGIAILPFDMSAFVGYTKAGFERPVDGDESKLMEIDVNSLTFQALISKKLSIFTAYGGVGYSRNSMGFKMTGSYDVDGIDTTPEIVDPIDLSASSGGPKLTAGFMLKLAVITLHFDYTLQEYSSFTGGLGISVR